MAHFLYRLLEIAHHTSEQEFDFMTEVIADARKELIKPTAFMPKKVKAFFDEVNRYLTSSEFQIVSPFADRLLVSTPVLCSAVGDLSLLQSH
ncbi:MAG: hypothetical protein GF384_05935 [Elusimicrobia bacterium]|nr:hypothetical protein [Elusimicrobiota bacterium]MBD3412292.1 hypothetical protein [Elusimicrobiota bacterium]